jgi:TonB-linked SusC/RagA family outer membrane protein
LTFIVVAPLPTISVANQLRCCRVPRLYQAVSATLLLLLTISRLGGAQSLAFTQHAVQPSDTPASVLDQPISVDIHNLSVVAAVEEVAAAAHVTVTINTTGQALVTARVSLRATNMRLREAFEKVLAGTGFHIEITARGDLIVVHSTNGESTTHGGATQGSGSVAGVVQDNDTHEPLFGVIVSLEGTARSASTGNDGRYVLRNVPPGEYHLVTRRLGYVTTRRLIVVASGEVLTTNLVITKSSAALDQVVTTVTGNQELRTMGNTIGVINADSLVPTTPVANLGDVLNARTPGVQVLEPGGITGASPQIQIRGLGALTTSTQPLLYIDGVRVSNSFIGQAPGLYSAAVGGRLNDIVPEEIESIEIVKGPSASTLYGTDAANGVILITTKRGAPGRTTWNVYGEAGALTIDPDQFSPNYAGWGHTASSTVTPNCTLLAVAAGSCTQDSITSFTPLRTPSLTPLGTGQREEAGLQVSGGGPSARYFISGNYTSEIGYLTLPRVDHQILDSLQGAKGVSGEEEHPNAVEKYGARVNVTTSPGRTIDISVATGLLSNTSRIPANILSNAMGGSGYRDANDGWVFGARPFQYFSNSANESADHVTGSVTTHWTPVRWFTGHATTGIDYSTALFDALTPFGINFVAPTGTRTSQRENIAMYSVDIGATADVPLASTLRSATSGGVQYNRTDDGITYASATNLIPGGTTVADGVPTGGESTLESVIAGLYAEERLSFRDRLFVTGAVRVDGSNTFGSDFKSATYPRVSASWIISQEPFFPHASAIGTVRLRAAYGESGTQPGLSLTTFQTSPVYVDGAAQSGSILSSLGNPHLQPERQKEIEGGADVDLFSARVHLEFTAYSKRNTNALLYVPLGASLGGQSILENIGEITNAGYEALVTVIPLRNAVAEWTITANGSINRNQVVSLGAFAQPNYGQYGAPGLVAGYPAYSFFDYPILGYKDVNGDGIIEPNEVTVGSTKRFIGPAYPPYQVTLATHVGFLHGLLQIGAQFDYRGGFQLPNLSLSNQCYYNACPWDLDRHTPLAQQAAAVANNLTNYTYAGFYSDAEFIRFRELSVTYDATRSLGRFVGARSLSVTLAARNLALWTRYTGADPETNGQAGNNGGGFVPQAGPYYDGGLPPAQYWLVRINMGY